MAGKTFEERLLAPVERAVQSCVAKIGGNGVEARFQVLEAAASRLGGFDLEAFQDAFKIRRAVPVVRLLEMARVVVESIETCGIPPALALSALARERLGSAQQKIDGAYHTDHRLAMRLAASVKEALVPGARVVDPACGAGILLAAVAIVACGPDRILAADWLSESVHASDMSPAALRGTLIALSSLTNDLGALRKMRSKWLVQDSLMAPAQIWRDLAPSGFDLVIGNPPWEKVKLSKHEFVRSNGGDRHYGQTFGTSDLLGYDTSRRAVSDRSGDLCARYKTLSEGEPDLYVAFTELMLGLTKPGGVGAILVPGGMIRSKGTEALRRHLLGRSQSLDVAVFDNKARFFAIDTRFKFLSVVYRTTAKTKGKGAAIRLTHAGWTDHGFEAERAVAIPRTVLEEVRPDLTVPEVRDGDEWGIFLKAQRSGVDASDVTNPWFARFCREVDMTHARGQFQKKPTKGSLAVVEGRMVQPHRFGAKSYVGGEGRAAIWSMNSPGSSQLKPQFWLAEEDLSPGALDRSRRLRAGFCDITGQTNERTMMASIIPPGVVCGNKVPTVLFPNDPREERLHLWVAIVNSLPFDWLMRRVVTTTVNYFLLESVRLPPLQPEALPARRLIEIAERLRAVDSSVASFENLWRIGHLRAEADVLVARAYGLTSDELLKMLSDFPLLDRGQPTIKREATSMVTRDLVMATWFGDREARGKSWAARVELARKVGAAPYVPGEMVSLATELRDAK